LLAVGAPVIYNLWITIHNKKQGKVNQPVH